ncbi:MAG: hypothetical protein LBM99_04835 [Bacillales bacterium]|jgi:hypothetical protein|nr:hypothetical protein [Bacillales bacterium]
MSKVCEELHEVLRKGKRFDFKSGFEGIPSRGIYVLFEKGEKGHDGDRIVRIGTHGTSEENDNLIPRLKAHSGGSRKSSVFRYHVGSAILNKANDDYLEKWVDKKIKLGEYGKKIEKQVSDYIKNNFYFVVLEVNTPEKRKCLESRLISAVSNCLSCKASDDWLGKFTRTPKYEMIIKSSLWNVDELYKDSLTNDELEIIEKHLVKN